MRVDLDPRSPPSLRPIGTVRSPLTTRAEAPKQGDEGAPEAWLEFDPEVEEGLQDLEVGQEVVLLTWFHRSNREVLAVHPRGDRGRRRTGVFSTRSPDRPNPIGLHRVTIVERDGALRIKVGELEAIDGTPVIDVKPVLSGVGER